MRFVPALLAIQLLIFAGCAIADDRAKAGCAELRRVADANGRLTSGPGGQYNIAAARAAADGARRCEQAFGGGGGSAPSRSAPTIAALGNLMDQLGNLWMMQILSGLNTWNDPESKRFRDSLKELGARAREAYEQRRQESAQDLNAAKRELEDLESEFNSVLDNEQIRLADTRAAIEREKAEKCRGSGNASWCNAFVEISASAKPGQCVDNWCYCPKSGSGWASTWCYGTSDPDKATRYIDAFGDGDIVNGNKGTGVHIRSKAGGILSN